MSYATASKTPIHVPNWSLTISIVQSFVFVLNTSTQIIIKKTTNIPLFTVINLRLIKTLFTFSDSNLAPFWTWIDVKIHFKHSNRYINSLNYYQTSFHVFTAIYLCFINLWISHQRALTHYNKFKSDFKVNFFSNPVSRPNMWPLTTTISSFNFNLFSNKWRMTKYHLKRIDATINQTAENPL